MGSVQGGPQDSDSIRANAVQLREIGFTDPPEIREMLEAGVGECAESRFGETLWKLIGDR
jgi:hypothetical protein